MGLYVTVGLFDEYEDAADVRREVSLIQAALTKAALGGYAEPEPFPETPVDGSMLGYVGLHLLRRLAVHLAATKELPAPLGDDDDPTDDPLLAKVYDADPAYFIDVTDAEPRTVGSTPEPFAHLLHHSDSEGYYVPVDFAPIVVAGEEVGVAIGSSQRLLDECNRLREALAIPPWIAPGDEVLWEAVEEGGSGRWQQYAGESVTCMQLIAAAEQSVRTGAAIAFG